MATPKEIIFKLGEETLPIVLDAENLKKSPFEEVISQAERRTRAITSKLIEINDQCKERNFLCDKASGWEEITPNNIIAFLGERGSGKTSCMRTIIKNFKNKEKNWLFLKEIDPSFFDETHNLLEILIGSLYGVFKENTKDWDKKPIAVQTGLRNIQEKFKSLKATLSYLKTTPDLKDEYEIDALNHLNSGGKIRFLMKELIDEMLKFSNKDLLVVSIDDLDLSIKQSYVMLEHIRKYLMIPNVIILVAAKYGQLFDSIFRTLAEIFKDISNRVSNLDIAQMTDRYLSKHLPLDQRFEMPSVESYINSKLIIIDENGTIHSKESILLGVPSLIFEKTRYLFYNSSGMPSLVIPRNLRELRMLTSMLFKMPSFEKAEVRNKQLFKEYFFESWLGRIDLTYLAFSKTLLEEENLAKINRFVIKNLYDFFLSKIETYKELKADLEKEEKEQGKRESSLTRQRQLLRNILNPENSYWNVSLGDVVTVINAVKKSNDSSQVADLLFFIESVYSIKLYETYDKMTALTDNEGLKMPVDNTETAPELKTSVRGDVPEYFRLSGGAFFSPAGDSFMPPPRKSESNISRELAIINGQILINEIRKLEKDYNEQVPKSSNLDILEIPANLTYRLRLCEFFILTVKNLVDLKNSDKNVRLLNEPVYFKKFGASAKNMTFDITMPFFNAIYPVWSYGRFGRSIYEIAKKDPGSVLNQMIKHKDRDKANETWELMSKTAIRNMEILEDLTEWLHERRSLSELASPNPVEVQRRFFSQFDFKEIKDPIPVGKYCVKTYGKTENGKNEPYYYIDYSVFAELEKVLAAISYAGDDKDLKELAKYGENFYRDVFNSYSLFAQRPTYTRSEIIEALAPHCNNQVLRLFFPEDDKDDITDNELARRLAEMRIAYGYDFEGKLPIGIQFYYSKCVETLYKQHQNEYKAFKENIDQEVDDLKAELTKLNEEVKIQNKRLKQNETETQKIQKETVKNNTKVLELQDNLAFFQSRIASEEDKAEIKRLRKEEEKTIKSLNAIKAVMNSSMQHLLMLKSDSDKIANSFPEYRSKIKDLKGIINQTQKDRRKKEDEFLDVETTMAHPIKID